MVIATLSTAHFAFVALGETEAAALAALKRGWARHRREYNRAAAWPVVPFAYYADGVRYTELEPGQCARDGERIC